MSQSLRGQIRCAKIERGKTQPNIEGFNRINVSTMSNNTNLYRNLSPMLLGPVILMESLQINEYYTDGILPGYKPIYQDNILIGQKMTCQTFERYWQAGKIYSKEVNPNQTLGKKFYEERSKMYILAKENKTRRRRKYPKKDGVPISSMYQGFIMDYVTSRKKIYVPYYKLLIKNRPEFLDLKRRLDEGENLLIVGPDGRDIPITSEELKRAINETRYPFGHELVICGMLAGLDINKLVSE